MIKLDFYYKDKKFKTIEEAIEHYKTKHIGNNTLPVDVVYCGTIVGYIDIDRLSAEVRRNASRG